MSIPAQTLELRPVTGAHPSAEAILSAVVFGTRDFLSRPDWSGVLETMLGRLGRATGADQVRVFRNDAVPADAPARTSLIAEWTAPGVQSPLGAADLQGVVYRDVGATRWEQLLSRGGTIVGTRAELPAQEHPLLDAHGIVSLAVVPIFVGARWWGFMGFSDCTRPRTWTAPELDALTAAAGLIGEAHARRETEERYHRLVEATMEGICLHDGERIIDVNPSLAHRMGFTTAEEAIGRSPFEFIHPDFHAEVRRRITEGDTHPYEVNMVRLDGTVYPAEIKGTDFLVDGRRLRVAAIRDITERKEAERMAARLREEEIAFAALEQTRRQAEFLLDASRILASSFDTTTTLRQLAHLAVRFLADYCIVTLYEEDAPRIVAVVHGDRTHQQLLERVVDGWYAEWGYEHPLSDAQRTGEPVIVAELTAEARDAMAGTVEQRELLRALDTRSLMAIPIRSGGELIGGMTFAACGDTPRFTPEHLALAQELGRRAADAIQGARSYHAARAATQARDDMLAVVAHDLRNPLNTVYMGSTLALELLGPDPDAPGRRQLAIIERSAKQMRRLIDDLLDATRLQSGQLELDRTPVPPERLLAEAFEMLEPLAGHAGLALEVQHDPGLPAILADHGRIQQVLSNLVGNAIKFTPRGGRITMAAQRAEDGVRFAVVDTGAGIAPDQLPHIFGRFWQARRTDRRGLGLGLSIAKGIVEAHGGTIEVASEPGAGSTFAFTVPIRGPEQAEARAS